MTDESVDKTQFNMMAMVFCVLIAASTVMWCDVWWIRLWQMGVVVVAAARFGVLLSDKAPSHDTIVRIINQTDELRRAGEHTGGNQL